ncbi:MULTISPECIES: hypothetical protein [unclassified Streptomyces]|uniref:hypothetical protein n=1 Tax=unclassified Streptomyces TaxID=2593676 RepID=UPI00331FD794
MQIIPSHGVDLVKVGDLRSQVEERVGPAMHGPGGERAVYDTEPWLVVTYGEDETVEVVELSYASRTELVPVHFADVQLTCRFLDDVVADLHALGYTSEPSDIGHEFHAGFAVCSSPSLSAIDIDPTADEDDERRVATMVSVAPASYFFGEDEEDENEANAENEDPKG